MIFHEIAVEPEAIQTLRDLQHVLGLAGFGKGRLISDFPHKGSSAGSDVGTWVSRVVESVKVGQVGKVGKVRELLISEKKRILKSKRHFHHNASWIENARRENERLAFSAMIIDGVPVCDIECHLDDLGGERIPPSLKDDQHARSVAKQPEQFAELLLPMTRCASALRFVDPHYLWWDERVGQLKLSRRHARVAEAIARRLVANDIGRTPNTVEFHMLQVGNDPEGCVRTFSCGMAAYLPKTWKATAFVWREIEDGRRFHARYILTDAGGVGSDYGLDEGRTPGDETDIYLLTEAMRVRLSIDFATSGNAFTLAAGPYQFPGMG